MTAAAPQYQDLLGSRIDRVGEHDTAAVLQALNGIISQDNDQQARFAAPDLLRLPPVLHALNLTADPGQAVLTVTRPDGSSRQETVTAEPARMGQATPPYPDGWTELPDTLAQPRPLHLRHRELPYWFDYLAAADLLYFQFNRVVDHPAEPFGKFCARLFSFIAARRPARLRRSARTTTPRSPPSWPRVNNCPVPEPDLSPCGPLVRHDREKIVHHEEGTHRCSTPC